MQRQMKEIKASGTIAFEEWLILCQENGEKDASSFLSLSFSLSHPVTHPTLSRVQISLALYLLGWIDVVLYNNNIYIVYAEIDDLDVKLLTDYNKVVKNFFLL